VLRAEGFRLLRIRIAARHKGSGRDAAIRATCVKKGLKLAFDERNPAEPYRYRESGGFVELEQVQTIDGRHAVAPPEQPDFFERFKSGAVWVGMTKTATV
jgi:hypothetical protein